MMPLIGRFDYLFRQKYFCASAGGVRPCTGRHHTGFNKSTVKIVYGRKKRNCFRSNVLCTLNVGAFSKAWLTTYHGFEDLKVL
jgi:hypothetical protein